ncbi:hypothetical protein [Achromobacter pestifer]|uniref:Uncharacterized protein n=1 Tax=Achromobacter pestifer TaxID=1353889 RepID=A0A6S6ZH21_9BURK|nr:hypothetical protein [Achromobacter pestifer]CAB3647739.1 hypothetical protein LMG3431_02595 [Achromobacter pestifer]
MQPQRHHFEGVPFIATPYHTGTYIREDVFWRQFTILCHGDTLYREDDPALGTYWSPGVRVLGWSGLIEEAMSLANDIVDRGDFGSDDDSEALSFAPKLVLVRDRSGRHVLAGEVRSADIKWCLPVGSDLEADQVFNEARELRRGASFEHMWDNFGTEEDLCHRASVLEGRLVDRLYRHHALTAIQTATH